MKKKPVTYDHPLEQRALERTLVLFYFRTRSINWPSMSPV